jgi:phosphonate transport system substrate-binding protein
LVIGVAPHTSARALFTSYQPLRLFLQTRLQRDVRIVSAPNFEEFLRRALAGRYDIAITTGHQARLLQTDAGFLPLVTYQADFRVVWVKAANNQAIRRLEDLSGRKVLGLGAGSLTWLWSRQQLAERDVVPASVGFVSASDSVAELIASGAVAAAALSQANLDRLEARLSRQLQVFERSPSFLGRVYMLNPRHADDYATLRQALAAFALTDAAQTYFQHSKLMGYREVQSAELEAMEPYAQALREQIKDTDRATQMESPPHDAK